MAAGDVKPRPGKHVDPMVRVAMAMERIAVLLEKLLSKKPKTKEG